MQKARKLTTQSFKTTGCLQDDNGFGSTAQLLLGNFTLAGYDNILTLYWNTHKIANDF